MYFTGWLRSLVRSLVPFAPHLIAVAVLGLPASAGLRAQVVADGYGAVLRALPASASSLAVLPSAIAWFDGTDLMLAATGQAPRSLLQFATPRFGSFTLPIGNDELLFADSSFDELWVAPLALGATPRLLTTVHFAYDAALLGTDRALVSAKTGGFGAGANDLIAVDLASGAQTRIGLVAGASGPVAVDRNGDLLYATAPLAFPPPPGTVEILRWSAVQWALALAGGPLLTRANAQIVAAGLDSAIDLALDDDDDLLFIDYRNARIGELDDGNSPAPTGTLIDYLPSSLSAAGLTFVAGPGATASLRQFEPFAQPGGGTLFVLETDFAATTQLRQLTPRAATLSATPGGLVPSGAFALTLQNGPPLGQALFVVGLVHTGVLLPIQLPGFEQVVSWDAGLLYPVLWSLQPCSALGDSSLPLVNPGFAPVLPIHTQALFTTATGAEIGATAALTTRLGL